jgi:hypothetical protein
MTGVPIQSSVSEIAGDPRSSPADDPVASGGQQGPDGGAVKAPILNIGYTTILTGAPKPTASGTRLTISWSKDTDLARRSHLGSQRLKKGAISAFIEDAVKWRLVHETVGEVRERFAAVPTEELDDLLNEVAHSVRGEKRRERKVRSRK